jgi:hypothetical protein
VGELELELGGVHCSCRRGLALSPCSSPIETWNWYSYIAQEGGADRSSRLVSVMSRRVQNISQAVKVRSSMRASLRRRLRSADSRFFLRRISSFVRN